MPPESLETIDPGTRKALRSWLEQNHLQKHSVWIRVYKGSQAQNRLAKDEVVDECLCFGWIDSRPRLRDTISFELLISPRKPKSAWSAVNKAKIQALSRAGLLTSAGKRAVKIAKENGSWDALRSTDRLEIPADLAKAFKESKRALENFQAFPPSARRPILEWIQNAKRSETRKQRIQKVLLDSKKNIRTLQWKRK